MKPFSLLQSLRSRVALPFLRKITPKIRHFAVGTIAHLLSDSQWYAAAFKITRFLTASVTPFVGESAHRDSWMLHFWVRDLLRYKRHFPIPIRGIGVEAVFEAKTNPKGMVVVSVHLPLANLVLRYLEEVGCRPDAVLAHGDLLIDGRLNLGGTVEGVPGLATDGNVLLRVRNILRRGGVVAGMIDTELGAPLNTNMLCLVGSVGARLVFSLAELGKDGEIVARFYTPPDPFCKSSEGILSNVEFFQARLDNLLQSHSRT